MIRRATQKSYAVAPKKSYAGHILPSVDAAPQLKQKFAGRTTMAGKQAYEEMAELALAHLDQW